MSKRHDNPTSRKQGCGLQGCALLVALVALVFAVLEAAAAWLQLLYLWMFGG